MATDPAPQLAYLEEWSLSRLSNLWVPGDPESLRVDLVDGLQVIGEDHGLMAQDLAGDWYETERHRAGLTSSFDVQFPDLPDEERWSALAAWGTMPFFEAGDIDPPERSRRAWGRITGGLQRTVLDMYRNTVTQTTVLDRDAEGWTRVGSGACPLCAPKNGKLITSDQVFDSHDHCRCRAIPKFRV